MTNVYMNQKTSTPAPEGKIKGMITDQKNKRGTPKFKKDAEGSDFIVKNVSEPSEPWGDYNLVTYYFDVETADGNDLPVQPAIQKSVPPTNKPAPLVESPDDRQRSIIRQHSQEMALRFLDLTGEKTASFKRVQEVSDWFENDANGEENPDIPF